MYGINSMEESASKICATIQDQPAEHAVVVMAHNGPSGLGSEQHDICGKDWSDKAGETLLHDDWCNGLSNMFHELQTVRACGKECPDEMREV